MNRSINIKGELRYFSPPWVMGIVNITPDSFYRKSRALGSSAIKERVGEMIKAGVDIVDIGAYSSRPGAEDISVGEELSRVRQALDIIRNEFPGQLLSLDTFRSEVARTGIEDYKVDIINDISAGSLDKDMFPLLAEKKIPYILMHMQGSPSDMQDNPVYGDVVNDILFWFSEKLGELVSLGVNDIIVDPGFGFGKTLDHNYALVKHLDRFHLLERPLLVGLSRKSMIWKELGGSPENTLAGTITLNTLALERGADIIRVHDVEEAIQTVKIFRRATD